MWNLLRVCLALHWLVCRRAPGNGREQSWTLLDAERPSSWVADPEFLFLFLFFVLFTHLPFWEMFWFFETEILWLQIPGSSASNSAGWDLKPALLRISLCPSFQKEDIVVVSLSLFELSSVILTKFFLLWMAFFIHSLLFRLPHCPFNSLL